MTKLLVMFLYFLPFIDLLTSIATWESKASIGLILKGLFVIIASIYLIYKNYQSQDSSKLCNSSNIRLNKFLFL